MNDKEEHSGYWEKEEFEDLVARSLIAMYETKIKVQKRTLPACRIDERLINRARILGAYFPSHDRIIMGLQNSDGKASIIQKIDVINDGRPNQAITSLANTNNTTYEEDKDTYLKINYMEAISSLPKPFVKQNDGKIYRVAFLYYTSNHITGTVDYVTINKNGEIYPVMRYVDHYDPITGRIQRIKNLPNGRCDNCEDIVTIWSTYTIQLYQDRRYLWNVRAKEGIAKATFAVHEEQIKSLFYSRELPMTETGRKRPILHWVKAHQRRMKAGTDYDIKEHLRGTSEFVYNGTKFEIINPQKEVA